uniref:Uncharacterized protein n=1 Tax=Sphaerodactylus townsendi TaxID=933632 RepID=A0ACB8FPL1_9SAUR
MRQTASPCKVGVGWDGVVVKQREAREESNVIINTSSQHGGPYERKGNQTYQRVWGPRLGKDGELVSLRCFVCAEESFSGTVFGHFVGGGYGAGVGLKLPGLSFLVVYEQEGVFIHSSSGNDDQESLLSGTLRVIEKETDVIVDWRPMDDSLDSSNILYARKIDIRRATQMD